MSNEYLDIAMERVIKQEVNAVLNKIRNEAANITINQGFDANECAISYNELLKIINKYAK